MPLDPRQAFKAGFLARCADAGLTSAETAALAKAAAAKDASFWDALGRFGQTGAVLGGTVALGAPVVAGALGGAGLAQLGDADDTDVADVKQRELVDEYTRQAADLKRAKAVRDYLRARRARPTRIHL